MRNGLDATRLTVGHRFYTRQYFDTFESEYLNKRTNLPWWYPEDVAKRWPNWNPVTQAANHWRLCVSAYPMSLRYEELCNDPLSFVKYIAQSTGLELTDMTYEFAETVLPYEEFNEQQVIKHGEPTELTLDMIEEPERTEFINTMERLGYK